MMNGPNCILLGFSSDNVIGNNTCSEALWGTGIRLYCSDNNLLIGNVAWGDSDGIYIGESTGNTLQDNRCNDSANAGINLYYAPQTTLLGNNCSHDGGDGVILAASPDCVVQFNNLSTSVYGHGLSINAPSDNTLVTNNMFFGNGYYGIYVTSNGNQIYHNIFMYNCWSTDVYNPANIQAWDSGLDNEWNTSGTGNYWLDWQTPDGNGDGIVDVPYSISGSASSADMFPLTDEPSLIPEFPMPFVVVASLVLMVSLLTAFRKLRRDQT
jgi:parallel beta-helix repeat protein